MEKSSCLIIPFRRYEILMQIDSAIKFMILFQFFKLFLNFQGSATKLQICTYYKFLYTTYATNIVMKEYFPEKLRRNENLSPNLPVSLSPN